MRYAIRTEFAGFVYNLETGPGWYVANGIVAHNCRCAVVIDPRGIANRVHVEEAVPKGTSVVAKVVAEGDGVKEAEHGDVYPFPVSEPVAKGTLFMHRAAVLAANTIRARQ